MLDDIKKTLWAAADKLRANMDAAEYKHLVLGLIFLKYVSDTFAGRRAELTRRFADESDDYFLHDADAEMVAEELEDRDYYTEANVFWVPEAARWENLRAAAKQTDIGKRIDDALAVIETENPKLKGILDKRYARAQLPDGKLGELVDLVSTIGFGTDAGQARDILGQVYEYFLGQFANAEGKKGGQFYTPASIVKILVAVLSPHHGKVYDPCCGSGGMFVQSEKFIEAHGGKIGDALWTEATINAADLLLNASDHEEVITKVIEQAHSRLLILSAHVSETVLNKLKQPINAAIQRGVRVDVLWGLPSLDEGGESHAKTTRKWLQEMRKSLHNGAGDQLTANEEPLNSDAKVLIWDECDGSHKAIVGSYNWLYGLDGPSAGRPGSEVGVRLSDPRIVGNICTTLSGWLDARGQQMNGIAFRWRNIGLALAKMDPPLASGDDGATTKVRVVYDESHAEILREGLVNASQRLFVSSHKLNRSATGSPNSGGGKLDWLARRNAVVGFKFVLVTGRNPKADSWTPEDQIRLEELVKGVDGSIRLGEGTHARVVVYDDVAVVSGYNFLSTTHDKRQVGVVFRGPAIANALWDAFNVLNT